MTPLYAYSLVPVTCVALLLFFTAALRGRRARGLAAYCLATAVWAATLLLTYFPRVAWLGQYLAASGTFVVAGYLHAAYDFTEQRSYRLVGVAYAVAVAITAAGAVFPGMLYDPVDLSAGPLFWESMALAMVAASVPMYTLVVAWRSESEPAKRGQLGRLLGAGALGYGGAWTNAYLLAHHTMAPYGIFAVLGSLLALTGVVQARQHPRERRLMKRSLLYAAMTSFLSAGFLLGVLTLVSDSREPLITEYRFGALFLLAMAALAVEPLRQHIQEVIGRRFATSQADAAQLADELAEQERRADQAERLAQLGTFSSAIAHEMRNPLGVLSGCVRLLDAEAVDPETVDEMSRQIERASQFLDELLAYGRPRPLELRVVDLADLVDLSVSSATQALGELGRQVDIDIDLAGATTVVEVDQSQISQVLVILVENAILAVEDTAEARIRIGCVDSQPGLTVVVEDNGPGLPEALAGRLFEPFVTGRKRHGERTGTGLGLAIARRIVERHDGSLVARDSPALGGARFEIDVPRHQNVLAAATAAPPE